MVDQALLTIFVLPWLLAAFQAFISFHWMLIGEEGLSTALSALFGVEGPIWFNDRWLALGSNIVSYIWKWMPFWTLIFLAGRMAIPREINEAAEVDGATGVRRFCPRCLPTAGEPLPHLHAALYNLDPRRFRDRRLVSGGAPKNSTDVLATLGFQYAFEASTRNSPWQQCCRPCRCWSRSQ